ncbi:MAG: hypothetical protein HY053_07865 [Proteobacteria bacterium]|nr:hypothetical protein [Pseudomonadota bacterium]
MVDGIGASLNGLRDASARIQDSARNIARASTAENPPVNMDKEVVDTLVSSVMYKANAKVLKAQLDNEKSLLDVLT